MAKKQSADAPEATDKPDTAAAPTDADQPAAKKPRGAGKGKEGKAKEAKAKPDAAPAGDGAPKAPQAATPAPGEPTKRKGKQPGKPPRRGKKLRNQLKNIQQRLDKEGPAPLKKALGLLKQVKRAKFDETVEVHMALGIDTTQSDQMIRGSVALPHGVGKTVRVLVFGQGDNVA